MSISPLLAQPSERRYRPRNRRAPGRRAATRSPLPAHLSRAKLQNDVGHVQDRAGYVEHGYAGGCRAPAGAAMGVTVHDEVRAQPVYRLAKPARSVGGYG